MRSSHLVLVGAAILFAGAAFASAGTSAAVTTVSGRGISVCLPSRWTGVIYQRVGGLPILHAANFRLPPVDGDDGANRAVRRMRPSDVLIVMVEYPKATVHFPRRGLPLSLRGSDFGTPAEGMPLSRAFARIRFTTPKRAFDVWIEFGRAHASSAAIRAVDRVLATLRIAARR